MEYKYLKNGQGMSDLNTKVYPMSFMHNDVNTEFSVLWCDEEVKTSIANKPKKHLYCIMIIMLNNRMVDLMYLL